ncbi:IclR family transcriptional regulator [Pseudonocardia acaciae]|uniref:IclR family transcriptional regulator n=1 Tax=Pseudonocardia acaciae TaxID=551276 RepID=UPI00048E24A1|nr:IclR family transcriptional regulator [Pseudonocardia acaciae]
MSQSLGRALRILARLGDGPASLDELADGVGVHKTTVLRMLRTLGSEHFVFRDRTHRYHLGARIHELSSRGLDQREVRGIALPHLAAFNREHGRTTHLSELLGAEIVYIDKLESHDHVRMASRVGLRAPVHCTAAGKALVAWLLPAELDAVLAALTFVPRTPNTITNADAFRAELDRVRAQGWAHDGEENEPSINCIAAPVRDATGRAVAAVSVSVPNIVMSDERLRELLPSLLAVTERISRDCGWRPVTVRDPVKGHP